MSKIKTKELIICIITVALLLLTIVTDVFATTPDINNLVQTANNTSFNEITAGGNNTSNTTNNLNNINATNKTNTNKTNTNKNNTTTMPNTGVDYSVVFIIAICGISAIYAYKKIKDYNNF